MALCPVCGRREPRTPLVCDADRSRARHWLAEIPALYAQLGTLGYVVRDEAGVKRWPDGRRHRHRDPVAHALPPGPIPGESPNPRVSGSPEGYVPAYLDLTEAVVRLGGVPVESTRDTLVPHIRTWREHVLTAHGEAAVWRRELARDTTGAPLLVPARDQTGQQPVAVVLDSWVRAWIDHRGHGEHRPAADVATLCGWLTDRLDDACDTHPAMDDFAAELGELRSALLAANGLVDVPDYKAGVPCPECDSLTLYQHNGSDRVECGTCPRLMTVDEYRRWAGLAATHLDPAALTAAERDRWTRHTRQEIA